MPDYSPFGWRRDDGPARRLQQIADLKEDFSRLNDMCIAAGNAWMTSVAGAPECRLEVIAGSSIPAQLEQLGYRLEGDGVGERILAHAITERFGRAADGTLVSITEGSTLPVVHRVAHAGIVGVVRYTFEL